MLCIQCLPAVLQEASEHDAKLQREASSHAAATSALQQSCQQLQQQLAAQTAAKEAAEQQVWLTNLPFVKQNSVKPPVIAIVLPVKQYRHPKQLKDLPCSLICRRYNTILV